jgi:hypothetical protein
MMELGKSDLFKRHGYDLSLSGQVAAVFAKARAGLVETKAKGEVVDESKIDEITNKAHAIFTTLPGFDSRRKWLVKVGKKTTLPALITIQKELEGCLKIVASEAADIMVKRTKTLAAQYAISTTIVIASDATDVKNLESLWKTAESLDVPKSLMLEATAKIDELKALAPKPGKKSKK